MLAPARPHLSVQDRRRLITSYLVMNIASATVVGAVQITVPLHALRIGASIAEIGLIRGLAGLGIPLLVIPAGFMVDHFGPKRLFIVGSLLAAFTTASLGLTDTPAALAMTMGLSGLLHALRTTALNASFYSNLTTIGFARAGWFKGSMAIGLAFAGPLLSGLLIDVVSTTMLFYLLAILTLLPVGLALAFLEDRLRSELQRHARPGLRGHFVRFGQLLAIRTIYLPLLTECFSTALFAAFSTFIAVIAVQELGQPPATASLLLGLEGVVFIATLFAGWPLLQALGLRASYGVSMIAIVVALALIGGSHDIYAIGVAAVVLGLGLGLTNLIVSDSIGRIDAEKGKVVALFSTAIGGGLAVGPVVGGAIGAAFGTPAIFLGFIPLVLLLGIAGSRSRRSWRTA